MNTYGKEKFDSEGKEEAKIGTEISFDSAILKRALFLFKDLSPETANHIVGLMIFLNIVVPFFFLRRDFVVPSSILSKDLIDRVSAVKITSHKRRKDHFAKFCTDTILTGNLIDQNLQRILKTPMAWQTAKIAVANTFQ